jgi:hypothetical protein
MEVTLHTKQRSRVSALITVCLLAFRPAAAQTLPDSEKIERLERQAELLQAQLNALQDEIAHMKKKAAKVEAVQPGSAAATAGRNPPNSPAPEALPQPAGINVTLAGFVEAASVFRTHNQVNDMLTVFDAVPYPSSPLYNEREFHGSARQSQVSVLAEGNIDAAQKLAGYFEIDFMGVGTSSNYVGTNDWPPRLRDAYLTYDNDKWGFHLLAGQEWSMIVPQKVGITPRQENIPLTINANYLVGFDFTRGWQIRAVKDFDKRVWFGVSVEPPANLNAPGIPQTVNGLVVNAVNTGTGGFLNGVMVTPSKVPDIIEKVAWDPGWGHYELLALQRFFTDNTLCATAAPTGCVPGTASRKTSFGAGVGGSVLLPVIPKYLQAMGGWSYGRGIGRYGAGNLPDIAPNGSLTPIAAFHVWAGIEVDRKGLQLFAYGGIEQERANYFDALGYGNPAFDNSGCTTPTAASFVTSTSATCVANTRRLRDTKAGFWKDIYKGPVGRFAAGVEFDHLKRMAFRGIGGAPSTDNNIIYTSLRYYFDTSLNRDHRPTGKQ